MTITASPNRWSAGPDPLWVGAGFVLLYGAF